MLADYKIGSAAPLQRGTTEKKSLPHSKWTQPHKKSHQEPSNTVHLSFLCLHMKRNNTVDWTETTMVWPGMLCLSSNSRLWLLSLSTVKLNHFLTWLSLFKVYFYSHSLPVALLTFPVKSWNHFCSQQSLKISWLSSRDVACYILSIHESTDRLH